MSLVFNKMPTSSELDSKSVHVEEYKCKKCNIEKPQIFFGATNGTMNDVCKMCIDASKKTFKFR